MPIIRDPIHNQKQGRYGLAWIEPTKDHPGGQLAVYDKKNNPYLRYLTAGYIINHGGTKKVNYIWCGITVELELTEVKIGHPEGIVTETLERHLREDHPGLLLAMELKESPVKDGLKSIYPIEEEEE